LRPLLRPASRARPPGWPAKFSKAENLRVYASLFELFRACVKACLSGKITVAKTEYQL
jgi:hypothetical protein